MTGIIHCIYGPMACNDGPNGYGKTGTLLLYVQDEKGPIFAFRPVHDERSIPDHISDRNNRSIPCIIIKKPQDILKYLPDPQDNTQGTIIIDEPHLLEDRWYLPGLLLNLKSIGYTIFVSGLYKDLDGYPIEPMKDILNFADKKTKLTATCLEKNCKNRAEYNWKVTDTRPTSGDVGKEYITLCYNHFFFKMNQRLRERCKRGKKYLNSDKPAFLDERG